MKKLIAVLVLAVGFTVTTQAQKENKRQKLTVEQQTELQVKKLTLKLDLTEAQQNQIKPLIAKQVAKRQEMRVKRKAMKESDKKPTAEERYEMKNKMLDKQIAFKAEMKRILNEQQYERFEKMSARKTHKAKKKVKKHRMKEKTERRDDER